MKEKEKTTNDRKIADSQPESRIKISEDFDERCRKWFEQFEEMTERKPPDKALRPRLK